MNATSRGLAHEAAEAARTLEGHPGLEAVILFGSVAWGTADEWSDVDLAVMGTAEACKEAERTLYERISGAEVQVVPMHAGNGYARAACWGSLGREALETGTVLIGGGETEKRIRMAETLPRTVGEVADGQGKILDKVTAALNAWQAFVERRGGSGLDMAAETSADAAGRVLKAAASYRGCTYAMTHMLEDTAEHARPVKEGPRILDGGTEYEVRALLRQWARDLNHAAREDHVATYFGRAAQSTAEDVRCRMEHLLRYSHEEHARLKRALGMERLAKLTREQEPDLGRAAEAVSRLEGDTGVGREGARWAEETIGQAEGGACPGRRRPERRRAERRRRGHAKEGNRDRSEDAHRSTERADTTEGRIPLVRPHRLPSGRQSEHGAHDARKTTTTDPRSCR